MEYTREVEELTKPAMERIRGVFSEIERIAEVNTARVLGAFRKHRVSDSYFSGTTGYGYDDRGREALDAIYAEIYGAEAGLVRIGFVNGTHAIAAALYGSLKPGEVLLSVTGSPYDTLCGVIGISGNYQGSLRSYGIGYKQVELGEDGRAALEKIAEAVREREVKAVFIQRSRGYTMRPAITNKEIGEIVECVRTENKGAVILVDNCYGEFVETEEPTHAGADLVAGSLIKNPGGGIALTGGYIAGRRELVENASYRQTAPGIGGECGATLGQNRALFQGLFMAPHVVAQAMKTAVFAASLLELMGYKTSPRYDEARSDIIQLIELGSQEELKSFCRGIQKGAPVDSFVTPEAWAMPGYECEVIMAAGGFVQGASIELSADAPLREPYRVYLQGSLTFEAGKLGIMCAASELSRKKGSLL